MIQKSEGCRHMTCITSGCNTHFCYQCGGHIIKTTNACEAFLAAEAHFAGGTCEWEIPAVVQHPAPPTPPHAPIAPAHEEDAPPPYRARLSPRQNPGEPYDRAPTPYLERLPELLFSSSPKRPSSSPGNV
ncbi:hypothetical protein DXG03_009451 [Asterophora parasitica]|uniref:IBR domain-containing protein n=1 Tax=Asterophora parasitica TaxID=117018 RepID=A0A9P7GBL4_9AGAR|nr:hypothetical protein DXG03_009451 [Asterophora parasitica]